MASCLMCLIIALLLMPCKQRRCEEYAKVSLILFDCSNCCMELVPHPSFLFYFGWRSKSAGRWSSRVAWGFKVLFLR